MSFDIQENTCSLAGTEKANNCPNYDKNNFQPKDCSHCEGCPYCGYDLSTIMRRILV